MISSQHEMSVEIICISHSLNKCTKLQTYFYLHNCSSNMEVASKSIEHLLGPGLEI